MTRPTDLGERITRLERLLDQLEQRRLGGGPASTPGDAPTRDDRLRDVVEMLHRRVGEGALDEGDAIAMQVMLAEYRSMTTELRAQASGLDQLLAEVAARLVEGHKNVEALEDL